MTDGSAYGSSHQIVWTPQPGPQTVFVLCPYREVFYGGAAGGGKSDALIGDFAAGIEQFGAAWHGIIGRRSFPQMVEIEKRCLEIFAPHYGQNSYRRSTRTWHFETQLGLSTLKLGSIDDAIKALDHQGQQYSWIGLDELTQWPNDEVLEYLITRLRSPKGSPTYVRLTGNPGGVGHNWVKARFRIGDVDPMTPFEIKTKRGSYQRVFIPAKLSDNIILMKNDPTYEDVLDGIADPVLRRALRDGDWNIAAGAAFPEFRSDVHIEPLKDVPAGVRIWRSMDWGYAKPYACLWFYADFDGVVHVIGELYGCGSVPDKGLKHAPEYVAHKIREIEKANKWDVKEAYLDPQCWAQEGGQTIFTLLGGHKMGWKPWPRGPGSRVIQKQVVHQYLQVRNDSAALMISARCKHLIRIITSIPLDRRNPEDIDTLSEDHLYDALRGGLARMQPNMKTNHDKNDFLSSLDMYDSSGRQTHVPGTKGRYGGW